MSGTREQILDVARELFVERGYDKTSLREVADRVGVTKAALYYHFQSKTDLLAALLQPVEDATGGLAAMTEAEDVDAWAAGLEEFIDWILRHRGLFEMIEHNEAAVAALSSEESSFGEAHQRFHDGVDAMLADDRLPMDTRVRLMCSLGTAISTVHFGTNFDVEADIDEIRWIVVDSTRRILGLRPRHGRGPMAWPGPRGRKGRDEQGER